MCKKRGFRTLVLPTRLGQGIHKAPLTMSGPVCPLSNNTHHMGQQHRKETKRCRRTAYLKRRKEIAKNRKAPAPQPARKVEA